MNTGGQVPELKTVYHDAMLTAHVTAMKETNTYINSAISLGNRPAERTKKKS